MATLSVHSIGKKELEKNTIMGKICLNKSVKFLLVFCIAVSGSVVRYSSAQSVLTLQPGTTMGVLAGADLCVNSIIGGGTLYGNGTICGGLVNIEPVYQNEIPKNFDMYQNYPNPFNPATVINYQLPVNSYVNIKVYDQLGREVYNLFEAEQNAGFYVLSFDGKELASGIYYYRISAISLSNKDSWFTKTMRMSLIK